MNDCMYAYFTECDLDGKELSKTYFTKIYHNTQCDELELCDDRTIIIGFLRIKLSCTSHTTKKFEQYNNQVIMIEDNKLVVVGDDVLRSMKLL